MARPTRAPALLMAVLLSGCGGPSGPDAPGECDLIVQVEGVLYALDVEERVPIGFTPDVPYATVVERRDCVDFVEDGEPAPRSLADAESTFLPAGTPLYRDAGLEVTDRLVAQWNGDWIVVVQKVLR